MTKRKKSRNEAIKKEILIMRPKRVFVWWFQIHEKAMTVMICIFRNKKKTQRAEEKTNEYY